MVQRVRMRKLFVVGAFNIEACRVQTYFSVDALFFCFGNTLRAVRVFVFYAEKFARCIHIDDDSACNVLCALYPLPHERSENSP